MSNTEYVEYNESTTEMLLPTETNLDTRKTSVSFANEMVSTEERGRSMTAGKSQRRDDVLKSQVRPRTLSMYDNAESRGGKGLNQHNMFGIEYTNSIWFHIPFINTIWSSVDDNADPPTFSEISNLLNTIVLAAALALAFVLTVHSAVGFGDLAATQNGGGGRFPAIENTAGADWRYGKNNVTGLCNTNYCVWWFEERKMTELPSTMMSWDCIVSEVLLTLCLLQSILILGTGVTNIFCRQTDAVAGFQARRVMRAYMKWVRWPILCCIIELVLGAIIFFWGLEKMVFIKYPDICIEQTGTTSRSGNCTYQVVRDAVQIGIIIPFALSFALISMGTHRAYRYPIRPDSDMKVFKKDRRPIRKKMVHFLTTYCGLPDNPGEVFLSAAGSIPSCEAEVISDALFDFGVITINELLEMVETSEDMLGEIPNIQLCARMKMIAGCQRYLESCYLRPFMGREEPDQDKPEEYNRYMAEKNMWFDAVDDLKKMIRGRLQQHHLEIEDEQLEGVCNILIDSDVTTEALIECLCANGLQEAFGNKGLSLGTILTIQTIFAKK